MKKILAIILCLAFVFTLSACGNKGGETAENKTDNEATAENGITIKDTVPENGFYYANGETSDTTNAIKGGEKMPAPTEGAKLVVDIAEYTYGEGGWSYKVKSGHNETVETVPEIYTKINGEYVVSMEYAFYNCANLKDFPEIPNTVTNMKKAFCQCTSMTVVPKIPNSVTNLDYAFEGCTSLTVAPELPEGITELNYTFVRCTALEIAPKLPTSTIAIKGIFKNCTNLKEAPVLHEGLVDISRAFDLCEALTKGPDIPSTVLYMEGTFDCCASLVDAPAIPENVIDISYAFSACYSLGEVEINVLEGTNVEGCFSGADQMDTNPGIRITGTTPLKQEIIEKSSGASFKVD